MAFIATVLIVLSTEIKSHEPSDFVNLQSPSHRWPHASQRIRAVLPALTQSVSLHVDFATVGASQLGQRSELNGNPTLVPDPRSLSSFSRRIFCLSSRVAEEASSSTDISKSSRIFTVPLSTRYRSELSLRFPMFDVSCLIFET